MLFRSVEGHHRALQFAFGHLAVGHQQPQAGDHLAQALGHFLDPLHPRHHVEDLAAAIELLADGAAHGLLIEGGEVRLDRPAQRRWRGDQAHLAHAREAGRQKLLQTIRQNERILLHPV